ncbi:PilT/PilU family type 4a pilus ATPase [Ectothiorhodospira lacustris]|uniref:PilT/PilU family type 4a pilus ATPase n=1 Tax=Ectothiorhodospira lacustris TaxID=2899127 RepID=UPI001EE8254C|nr:PilT/PilU family type 4a pilus ATPase [Ectothiorhodospira lacustris]MCG5500128.1 PilT/PilU family type 4a pilus ATPase [Ectothiorhodospira lacustris]MCG5510787.1 PilT/PilU family type 4a pilus ATPase [Ectothiorhodospira lacustris]MCG5522519.1 PilT/PilU family type 4a pilus ATPase [Ectothiorhodospira lacustris]
MLIEPYLKLMAQKNASDLFFTTGASACVKIEGDIRPISRQPLQPGAVKEMAYDIMDERQIKTFEQDKEMNLGISLEGLGRFRVNIYVQRGEVSMVIRFIKSEIPTIEQLKLPPVLKELVMHDNGLILVVGATGSGKSTTLASMIDHRNSTTTGHILTIEDPIEYSFTHKKSIIGQREVGLDTLSYDNALREAMREAPDMIMIGEVRDLNTMKAAIAYADTGHLALSTLHAVNANQALDRIINFFPPESKQQILMDLSLNLRGIVSQRLLLGKEGNRLPAVEVMVNTPYISELIRKGEINAIKQVMEKGGSVGMQTFDQSLFELYKAGLVTLPEALAKADSRGDLEWRIHFGGGVKSLKKDDDDLAMPGDSDPAIRGKNDGRKGFDETLRPLSETKIKE